MARRTENIMRSLNTITKKEVRKLIILRAINDGYSENSIYRVSHIVILRYGVSARIWTRHYRPFVIFVGLAEKGERFYPDEFLYLQFIGFFKIPEKY